MVQKKEKEKSKEEKKLKMLAMYYFFIDNKLCELGLNQGKGKSRVSYSAYRDTYILSTNQVLLSVLRFEPRSI